MAVTRLKRKDRKNKVVSKLRRTRMKLLNAKPVIKKVDIEEIKASFKSNTSATTKDTKKEDA